LTACVSSAAEPREPVGISGDRVFGAFGSADVRQQHGFGDARSIEVGDIPLDALPEMSMDIEDGPAPWSSCRLRPEPLDGSNRHRGAEKLSPVHRMSHPVSFGRTSGASLQGHAITASRARSRHDLSPVDGRFLMSERATEGSRGAINISVF
jgi:hypothetical protein